MTDLASTLDASPDGDTLPSPEHPGDARLITAIRALDVVPGDRASALRLLRL